MSRSFDPEQFLHLAYDLGARAPDEAALRSAVGRAYYACVLVAAEVTGTSNQRGFHKKLRSRLSEELKQPRIATRMGQMCRLRDVADYQVLPDSPNDRDWIVNWHQIRDVAEETFDGLVSLRDNMPLE